MNATLELTQEEVKKRMEQVDEMAEIWEESADPVQMYLKGCIVTANALYGNHEMQKTI